MAVSWITVTQAGSSWVSATEGGDSDWLDPRLTPLLTEAGAYLLAENGHILCTEAVNVTPSPWVPL